MILQPDLNGHRESLIALQDAAEKFGPMVNEAKTKYLRIGGGEAEVGPFRFGRVSSFVYLRSEVKWNNDIS